MKFNRWWLCVCLFIQIGFCSSLREEEEEDEGKTSEPVHRLVPRWLSFFSRGPEKDDEKYEGKSIVNHIDNVLKGGTVGVQVDMKKHVGKLDKLWGKLKKYFSGFQKFMMKRPSTEDKELEGVPPEGRIDPRTKWTPFRIVTSERMARPDMRDMDNGLEIDPESAVIEGRRPEVDPDSEIFDREFGI